MKHSYEQLKADILFEQSQLDVIVAKIKEAKGNITESSLAAIATYLMNFYNGIENIMKRSAKEYYKKMPKGNDWHKQLLKQCCKPRKNKIFLFNENVADKLYDYLAFRHFFIHGYVFNLSWNKMEALVDNIGEVLPEANSCIANFIKKI